MFDPIANEKLLKEDKATQSFLESPTEDTFQLVFKALTPQLISFFRARGCELASEDLAQDVMFIVCRKAGQLRDRGLFRAWLFKIARSVLYRYHGRKWREGPTIELE